ncbi:unnamed protein product, partial [Effrenium voratum]
VLAITWAHAAELDATTAVAALEVIAGEPERVQRDMRVAKLVFDLNTMAHCNRIRGRLIPRCVAACSKLGLRQPSLFFCLCAAAQKRIQEFSASELAQLLYHLARSGISDLDFLKALTCTLPPQLHCCSVQQIGEVAWALAVLRFRSAQCLAALHGEACSRLRDFQAESLSHVLWCLDCFGQQEMYLELANRVVDTFDLGQPENHLLAYSCLSISCQGQLDHILQPLATDLARLAGSDDMEISIRAQHLGPVHTARVLSSLGVQVSSGSSSWARAALCVVQEIEGSSPVPMEKAKVPVVDADSYAQSLAKFGVDNFGKIGGRCLLNQLGIGRLEDRWLAEVKNFIAAWSQGVGRSPLDWKAQTAHRRIYAFAEFHFTSLHGRVLLEGTLFQLNGLWADPECARRPWLCAIPLPISKWVDRTLCAEFQLLGEVCEMLNRSGIDLTSPELRYSVKGCLNLYLSEPSCVSCIGAMRQFQTMLPGVDLFVEAGSDPVQDSG